MKRFCTISLMLALCLTACGPKPAGEGEEGRDDANGSLRWTVEQAMMREAWDVSVDGSITDYEEVAQRYAQDVAEKLLDLPSWHSCYVLDVQNIRGFVSDAYTGQPENFYGSVQYYFAVEDGARSGWQVGSGMEQLTEGPYAGYWSYGIGAHFARNDDGDWVCTGTFTGGPILTYPTSLEEATVEQLLDYFFHTTGEFERPYRIPLKIRERGAEQLAALNEILPQYPEEDAKALCQTLGNHAKTYDYREDCVQYDDLYALLDAPYRDWLATDASTPAA